MSQFEFIFVLVSIVLALALTRLLDGMSHVLQLRMQGKRIDAVHLVFSVVVVVLLVIVWWALFRWDRESAWTYPKYLVIILHMASFYALSAILYPGRESEVPGFEQVRASFYLVLAANTVLEMLHTYMLGALFTPWYYLPTTGLQGILCVVGMIVRRRGADWFIGGTLVMFFVIWPFVARFTV